MANEPTTVPQSEKREPKPRETELAAGERIGDYRVDGPLGSGAFGTVYRATHAVIGKQAAIKVLKHEYASDETLFSRFIGEARAVNAISHPNIVDIFGFGKTDDGRHYIVMELLRGESLADHLAKTGRLTLEATLAILRPLADALSAAHDKGITHRDLKPDNVFLQSAPLPPKLLDFGIAKLPAASLDGPEPLTRAGWIVGTPGYMSPEQTVGESVDGRSDIYAFGVLAYRMLAGRLPFDGPSLKDILAEQLQSPPPSLSVYAQELPKHLDAAFRWLLHKDVPRRCPDMKQALGALEGSVGVPLSALAENALTVRDRPAREAASSSGAEAGLEPTALAMPALMREAQGNTSYLKLGVTLLFAVAALVYWFSRVETLPAEPPTVTPHPTVTAPPNSPEPIQPPKPAVRLIAIDGDPPGADILGMDGAKLGKVPVVLELDPTKLPIEVELRKEGFVPQTYRIAADSPETLRVSLTPRRGRPLIATPAPR